MSYRLCIILMILSRARSLEAAGSASKLCNTIDLSCSSQVSNFNLTDDDCKMLQKGRNSKECSSLIFNKPGYAATLGNVGLQAYFHNSSPKYPQTAFNVTFTRINWTSIFIRFMQIKEPEDNVCKEFQVSDNFLAYNAINLFYDCIWTNEYEGKTYYFEYFAKKSSALSYGKYVFKVPENSRIDPNITSLKNWEIFMYIDITNSPLVILKFQTLPKNYRVTNYSVEVLSGKQPYEVARDHKIVFTKDNEGSYEWNLEIFPLYYYFRVTPLSPICDDYKCHPSESPLIRRDLPIIPLLIGGVVFIMIFLMLFCVYMKLKIKNGKHKAINEKPTLLLIYHGTHSSHIKVVLQLANYLNNCNIIVMVDELDVNRSKTQDPFNWYKDAIAKADFIGIVSSPRCCSSVDSIYPNAEQIALWFLNEIRFRRSFSKVYNLMKFLLPYCSKNDLPEQTENIGLCFKVPNQLHEIIYYVHNLKEMCFLEKLCYWIKSKGIFIRSLVGDKKHINKESKIPEIQEASAEVSSCRANGNSVLNNNKRNNVESTLEMLKKLDTKMKIEDSCGTNKIHFQDPLSNESSPFLEYPGSLDQFNLSGKMQIENSCGIKKIHFQDPLSNESSPFLEYPSSLDQFNLSGEMQIEDSCGTKKIILQDPLSNESSSFPEYPGSLDKFNLSGTDDNALQSKAFNRE